MINELFGGLLVGTFWLFGLLLYKLTNDEIDVWAKKRRKLTFKIGLFLAVVFALATFGSYLNIEGLVRISMEVDYILLFAVGLFASSWYGVNKKPRHQIIFFIVHSVVFLVAFYLAQVF
jgi:hypothetical protein